MIGAILSGAGRIFGSKALTSMGAKAATNQAAKQAGMRAYQKAGAEVFEKAGMQAPKSVMSFFQKHWFASSLATSLAFDWLFGGKKNAAPAPQAAPAGSPVGNPAPNEIFNPMTAPAGETMEDAAAIGKAINAQGGVWGMPLPGSRTNQSNTLSAAQVQMLTKTGIQG